MFPHLERLLELVGLVLFNLPMLLKHQRQPIIPAERLVIRAYLRRRQRRNVQQKVQANPRLEQLFLQFKNSLRFSLLHRVLQLHQLRRISRRRQTLLSYTLELSAQLFVVLKVLSQHPVQQLVHQILASLSQSPDQLVAVQLEHAHSDHLLRVVGDVLGQPLVLLQLALILVERVLLPQELLHVLVSPLGYEGTVLVEDF